MRPRRLETPTNLTVQSPNVGDHRTLKLLTLGASELRTDGDGGDAGPSLGVGKPFALLTYLSAAPNRTSSRNNLISLLWADLEPDAAKHALRQTIWYLRHKTSRDLAIAVGDALQLSLDVTVDRDALLAASSAADHDRVVRLYAGPFIPSFAAPGGSGFEDWCSLERRRLLEVFRHSAEAVTQRRLATGHARDAVDLARKLRDQDIYNEGGWRLLIETCTSADDLLAAKAEAEALLQLAERDELELEPATHAAIRSTRVPSASNSLVVNDDAHASGAITGSLVGREAAFVSLLDSWDSAKAGPLVRVHINARAGIGKSRLLRDFASRIRGMRGRVVQIGGSLGTRDIAYSLAGELAAALAALPGKQGLAPASAAVLIELNPSLSTWFDNVARLPVPDDLLRARTLALRELATAVAYEHAVAILIDDLHWCDENSIALLTALVEGLHDATILLVSTGRPEALRTSLASHVATRQVSLEPLSAVQVEELVLSVAALPPEDWAAAFAPELWRASRGSPLLALEMLQLLEDRAVLRRAARAWYADRPDALMTELRAGDVLRARIEDLDPGDRWILTLLSTAGTYLDTDTLADAAGRPGNDISQHLRALEARGFVVRGANEWRIAHDEISEEFFRLATDEAFARACNSVGRALYGATEYDETRTRRAAQLLRRSGDPDARADVFRRFALRRYESGDRRPVSALAADLLGPASHPSELAEVVNASPLTWRLGLVSRTRRTAALGAAAALMALAAIGVFVRPSTTPPDAVLGLAFVDSVGRVLFESVDIREQGWTPLEPLETRTWHAPAEITLPSANGFGLDYSRTTGQMVTTQAVQDDGVIDLFLYEPGKPGRRLAPAPRDDGGPRFSPDDTQIAFSTARWDTLSRYDIAVLPLKDSVPRRLTSGPASDAGIAWSPNGGRIAFARSNWGSKPNEICVIALGDGVLECHGTKAERNTQPEAWLDEDRLVVVEMTSSYAEIAVLQWSTQQSVQVFAGALGSFSLSRDSRWLFCLCAASAKGELVPAVLPLAAPNLVRPIRPVRGRSATPMGMFWIATGTSASASTLRIRPQPVVQAGVPAAMRASLRDSRGNTLAYDGGVRWSLRDATGGTIDSLSGTLIASGSSPSVLVYATARTSARDSSEVRVSRVLARLRLEETWADSLLSAWLPFGSPSPRTGTGPNGEGVFLNSGEGSFESGVLSRPAFNAQAGVAVDVRFSTPITLAQWQRLHLGLRAEADTARYRLAAGRNAHPRADPVSELCSINFPQEGRHHGVAPLLSIQTESRSVVVPIDASVLRGSWHSIRVQRLPDGRCGFALDGKPLAILFGGELNVNSVRVFVSGSSYQTRVAVGTLRVYEGVLTDIDWTKAKIIN